jgi:hypothetical protein
MSLNTYAQDIVVWKIKPEHSPEETHLILTYYKNGHNAPRHFADRLFEGKTTPQLYDYTQNNKIDKVTFIVRHPFDRLISGIKQQCISFANIGSINSHTENYNKSSFLSDYITYQDATKFIHDERLWKEWLYKFAWESLEDNVHTKRYLNCFQYFAQLFSKEGIKQNIIDVDAMTYYFATHGCFLPMEHQSGMSGRIDNLIMDFIKEGNSDINLLKIISNHIDPEVQTFKSLKPYNNYNESVIEKIIPKTKYDLHYCETIDFYRNYIEGHR